MKLTDIILLAFGLPEWGLILAFVIMPLIIFGIGYNIGKKSGYLKRVKEQENSEKKE